jgi:3',5'-cyclic AMP phosphodiesterase CpdA
VPSPAATADPPTEWALAHLSDLHLTDPLAGSGLPLRAKQRLGRASWRRRRSHIHQPAVLAALIADLHAQAPRQIAISGDLLQIGLPGEFAQAAQWLAGFVPPSRLLLVPGNHEAYVPNAWQAGREAWRPYLQGVADGEPWLLRRGPLLLIGLSSAVPTWPGLATGTLGRAQLAALEAALVQGARDGLFRVVVIHHPPVAGVVGWRKRLTDRRQFAAIIARHGAGLILHGHAHRVALSQLPGPDAPVAVLGAPSASALDRRPGRMAGYSLLRIGRSGNAWQLRLSRRVYRPQSGDFDWLEHLDLATCG